MEKRTLRRSTKAVLVTGLSPDIPILDQGEKERKFEQKYATLRNEKNLLYTSTILRNKVCMHVDVMNKVCM